MDNDEIYSVLKCIDGDKEIYIYSTISENDNDESHKYYYLTVEKGLPTITDIKNPIDVLKKLNTKAINIQDDTFEYMKFLAYRYLAKNKLMNTMSR